MSLEARLRHAARELREVDIDPERPQLTGPVVRSRRARRRAPVAAVPVLFAVGGLLAATDARGFPSRTVVAPRGPVVDAPTDGTPRTGGSTTAPQHDSGTAVDHSYDADHESELIARLPHRPARSAPATGDPADGTAMTVDASTARWDPV